MSPPINHDKHDFAKENITKKKPLLCHVTRDSIKNGGTRGGHIRRGSFFENLRAEEWIYIETCCHGTSPRVATPADETIMERRTTTNGRTLLSKLHARAVMCCCAFITRIQVAHRIMPPPRTWRPQLDRRIISAHYNVFG
jgi:hypothetical protein